MSLKLLLDTVIKLGTGGFPVASLKDFSQLMIDVFVLIILNECYTLIKPLGRLVTNRRLICQNRVTLLCKLLSSSKSTNIARRQMDA